MLDQIPALGELQRYLEHLSMMDPPAPRREVILEQVGAPIEKLMEYIVKCQPVFTIYFSREFIFQTESMQKNGIFMGQ